MIYALPYLNNQILQFAWLARLYPSKDKPNAALHGKEWGL